MHYHFRVGYAKHFGRNALCEQISSSKYAVFEIWKGIILPNEYILLDFMEIQSSLSPELFTQV